MAARNSCLSNHNSDKPVYFSVSAVYLILLPRSSRNFYSLFLFMFIPFLCIEFFFHFVGGGEGGGTFLLIIRILVIMYFMI